MFKRIETSWMSDCNGLMKTRFTGISFIAGMVISKEGKQVSKLYGYLFRLLCRLTKSYIEVTLV